MSALLILAADGNLARVHADEPSSHEAQILNVIDNVPLRAAIRNLAGQARLNIILDPHVPGEPFARNRRFKETRVSRRWTNATPEQALRTLLKENQLIIVTNPVTTVARIAPGSVAVWPVNPGVAGIDHDKGEQIPLIVIDDVPVLDALRNVCRQAGLKPIFDQDVSETFEYNCGVYVYWQNVTIRQALGALLDDFGLMMKENPSTGTARIRFSNRNQRKYTAGVGQ